MTTRLDLRTVALLLAAFALLLVAGGPARAAFITLDAVDSGGYTADTLPPGRFSHDFTNKDIEVSFFSRVFVTSRSAFLVFDLPEFTGQIIGAQLVLGNPQGASGTFSLWDVTTPVGDLVADQAGGPGSLAQMITDDLRGGTLYSSEQTVAPGQTLVTIPLNGAALQAVAAQQGLPFAVGVATAQNFTSLFGSDGQGSVRQLVLEVADPSPVPEPSALALLGLGAAGLLGFGRRSRPVTAC